MQLFQHLQISAKRFGAVNHGFDQITFPKIWFPAISNKWDDFFPHAPPGPCSALQDGRYRELRLLQRAGGQEEKEGLGLILVTGPCILGNMLHVTCVLGSQQLVVREIWSQHMA